LEQVALDIKKYLMMRKKKKRPMNKSPQLIGDQVPLITSYADNDQQSQYATKGLHG
jgi:hypothetical protein